MLRRILRQEYPTTDVYVLVAAARRGFKMVLWPPLQRRVVLQWAHSLRQWAVETPLSEVHVLHRVLFWFSM